MLATQTSCTMMFGKSLKDYHKIWESSLIPPKKWRGWLSNDPLTDQPTNPYQVKHHPPSSQGTVRRLPELLRNLLHHGLSCWMEDTFDTADVWCFGAPLCIQLGEFWYHQIGNKNGCNFTSNAKSTAPEKAKRLSLWNLKNDDFATWLHQLHVYMKRLNTCFQVWIYIWKTNSPNSNETIKRALEARGKASLLRI